MTPALHFPATVTEHQRICKDELIGPNPATLTQATEADIPEDAPASQSDSLSAVVYSQMTSVDVKDALTQGGDTHDEHFDDSGPKTLTVDKPPKMNEYDGVGIWVCTGVGVRNFAYRRVVFILTFLLVSTKT